MHLLLSILSIAVQTVLIAMLADFIAGLIHWAEDAYFTEDTPIIGPLVIRPNIVHHHFPRYFTKLSWWESSWLLLVIGGATLGIAYALGALSWQLALFVAISVNANHVHKLSHRTRAENGPLISKLQDWRILQTPRQHGLHHTDPKNTYYCPVTNLVNPLLERINFWARAEAVIERLTGATHRHDTAVRGQGPGPHWLDEFRPHTERPAAPASPCVCKNCPGSAGAASCPKRRTRIERASRLVKSLMVVGGFVWLGSADARAELSDLERLAKLYAAPITVYPEFDVVDSPVVPILNAHGRSGDAVAISDIEALKPAFRVQQLGISSMEIWLLLRTQSASANAYDRQLQGMKGVVLVPFTNGESWRVRTRHSRPVNLTFPDFQPPAGEMWHYTAGVDETNLHRVQPYVEVAARYPTVTLYLPRRVRAGAGPFRAELQKIIRAVRAANPAVLIELSLPTGATPKATQAIAGLAFANIDLVDRLAVVCDESAPSLASLDQLFTIFRD